MSKKKSSLQNKLPVTETTGQSESIISPTDAHQLTKIDWKKRLLYPSVIVLLLALVGVGVLAKNNWLPRTDAVTGQRTGWFGQALPENAASSWNPLAAPLPPPAPQLSKEYVYAGSSRLLAVEDANATATSPADLAVWRPSTGLWSIRNSGTGGTQTTNITFGLPGDQPVPGDFDGDSKTDLAVFRPNAPSAGLGTWYIFNSADGSTSGAQFGLSTDVPIPADYDGDGKTDPAVFRPTGGNWYILKSSDGTLMTRTGLGYGAGDRPAPADYDGDGRADIAVRSYAAAGFYIYYSTTGQLIVIPPFGASADQPVPGDYDGDGRADPAIRSGAGWAIRQSSNNQLISVNWGQAGDVAVQNDYDGDGRVDVAVWRNSNATWYIRNSSTQQTRQQQFGQTGDIPVPAFWRR